MPLLGDVFLNTVYDESLSGSVKASEHPIENGGNVTDHTEVEARTMKISGICTGPDASVRRAKLDGLKGKLTKYSYRNVLTNVLITDLKTSHDVDVAGGFKFDITLKEVKISKAAVIKNVPVQVAAVKNIPAKIVPKVAPVGNKGLQQTKGTTAAKMHTVKAGETLAMIAAKYGVSVAKLIDKNRGIIGNDRSRTYVGLKLIIPTVTRAKASTGPTSSTGREIERLAY